MDSHTDKFLNRRRILAACLLLFAAASLCYANALYNEFVFDDVKMVEENTAIRSFKNVPMMFANLFKYKPIKELTTVVDPAYRPVRFLSYVIDYQFTGLEPVGYHISNIIYHALCGIVLFFLLKRLVGSYTAALVGALLFVIHPVNTEAVAYISGRKDLLVTLFYLLAILSYIRFRENSSLRWASLTAVIFIAGLLTKETMVTLPVALIMYEILIISKESAPPFSVGVNNGLILQPPRYALRDCLTSLWQRLKSPRMLGFYVFLIAVAGFYSFMKVFIKSPAGMGEERVGYIGDSFFTSALTISRVLIYYIRLLFIPHPLSADYSFDAFPASRSLLDPFSTLLALLTLAGLIYLGMRLLLRGRLAGYGILLFFVTLIPVMQIVPIPERIAERFLYLPMLAVSLLVALLVKKAIHSSVRRRWLATLGLLLILPSFCVLTVRRNRVWQNTFTLFADAATVAPRCARAQLAIAEEHLARDELAEALQHAEQVLQVIPPQHQGRKKGIALNAVAVKATALGKLGKYEESLKHYLWLLDQTDIFGRKVDAEPEFLHIHQVVADTYLALGRLNEAETHYRRTVELAQKKIASRAPHSEEEAAERFLAEAYFGIASCHSQAARHAQAARCLEEADKFANTPAAIVRVNYYRGMLLRDIASDHQGAEFETQVQGAKKAFEKVIRSCHALRIEGERQNAETMLCRSYYYLSEIYSRTGRLRDAKRLLLAALAVDPEFTSARLALGEIYFTLRRHKLAQLCFEQVIAERISDSRAESYLQRLKQRDESVKKRKSPSIEKADVLLCAADTNFKGGDTEKATSVLQAALAILKQLESSAKTELLTGKVRLLLSEIAEEKDARNSAFALAENALRHGLRLTQDKTITAQLYDYLGRLYTKRGEDEKALAAFVEAQKALPDYPHTYYFCGIIYKRQGNYFAAIGAFRKSIRSLANVTASHLELGTLYFEMAEKEPLDKKRLYQLSEAELATALSESNDEKLKKEAKRALSLLNKKMGEQENKETRK